MCTNDSKSPSHLFISCLFARPIGLFIAKNLGCSFAFHGLLLLVSNYLARHIFFMFSALVLLI